MGALMRAYDWDAHPLGNPGHWPASLKNNIRLLLHSGFPMFLWWSEGLYAFHNDAYLPALGDKHPQALGMSAQKVWAEIWKDVGGIAESIMNGGDPYYVEGLLLLLERKGYPEETYWTFSYSPAFNDAGQVYGIYCACSEVTSTVLGQRRLKAMKDISDAMSQINTLEQACQSACDILASNPSDIPCSLIYLLNPAHTEAKLLGKGGNVPKNLVPVLNLTNPQMAEECLIAEVQRTRQPVLIEQTSTAFAGENQGESSMLPWRGVVVPIFNPGQEDLLGFFVSGLNAHLEYDADYRNFHGLLAGQIATSIASVQAREAGQKRQDELIELFQQAPVAICVLRGTDYVVELANPLMCELWGKTMDQVIGKPVFVGVHEAKDQGLEELLDGVITSGEAFVANGLPVMLNRGGEVKEVYVNLVYHPMRNSQGHITGVIAVALDVSVQVEARKEVESVNRELLAINADLDNFVYSASHDLKAPISNIEGLMDVLVENIPAEALQTEEVSRVVRMIQSSVDRFKRTVADLSEVAKIQRLSEEAVGSVNLQEVVEEVLLDLEPMINTTNARIECDFTENVPIQYSFKNLRSVVYNLLSNGLKYRSPDRQPLVQMNTRVTPDFVVFSLSDNGLGMLPTDKEKVFTMFKRLHNHVEGSGVGLYIVKRIIENAGGRIEIESELGQGSTFHVYLKR